MSLKDLNYIFVCYPHGGGGEFLSYIISKAEECNTLVRRKVGNRTKVHDIFNQHMLRIDFNIDNCFNDHGDLVTLDKDKYVVVPTHYRESAVEKYFENYKFINIVYPKTEAGKKRILRNAIDKVWKQPQPTQLEFFGTLQQLEKVVGNRNWFLNTHFSMNTIDIFLASQGQEFNDHNRESLLAGWMLEEEKNHGSLDSNLCIEYEKVKDSLQEIGKYLGITVTEEMQQGLHKKIHNDEKL